MKRSRTTALLLMSTAPLLFTACQQEQAVQVQEGLYTSVEACSEATGDPSSCRQAFAAAQQQAADAAPQYASREECAKEYPAEQCVQQHTSAGHSFAGPMMMGFFMSQMLNSGRAGAVAAPPAAQPAFKDNANTWAKPAAAPGGSGGLNTASRIGAGKAGLAPVASEPNRAVTASRGGFGSRSGGRTTVGG